MTAQTAVTTGHIRRFDLRFRILHGVIMTTFLGLAATGLPLLFSDATGGRALAGRVGGFQGAGLFHRFFGGVLLAAVVWHVGEALWRAFVRGESGILWGPTSMVPQPRDFVDFFQQMRWFLRMGPPPRLEQFTYWEKFDYWAVLWGTGLMGAAGLVLWFPQAASRILPGWMFNVALFVHGAEATLAIGFIFVVHFFNGHLRPGKFPMDMVWFTGSVADHHLKEEREAQYDRLIQAGGLDALSVAAPTDSQLRKGHVVGTVGLSLGIGFILLILYAVL